ncbi:hypothetical protein VUR80DRAFT_7905 [Thermomyces stellatus]
MSLDLGQLGPADLALCRACTRASFTMFMQNATWKGRARVFIGNAPLYNPSQRDSANPELSSYGLRARPAT